MLKRYLVYTPDYEHSSNDWYEPPEYGADCVEVDAENKRDAIILGTQLMLKSHDCSYCSDNRSDGLPPFAKVKAALMPCEEFKETDGEVTEICDLHYGHSGPCCFILTPEANNGSY